MCHLSSVRVGLAVSVGWALLLVPITSAAQQPCSQNLEQTVGTIRVKQHSWHHHARFAWIAETFGTRIESEIRLKKRRWWCAYLCSTEGWEPWKARSLELRTHFATPDGPSPLGEWVEAEVQMEESLETSSLSWLLVGRRGGFGEVERVESSGTASVEQWSYRAPGTDTEVNYPADPGTPPAALAHRIAYTGRTCAG